MNTELKKISVGAAMGLCSGIAAKRVGTNVAVYIGCGFACVQGLAYFGYIDINWNKVEDDFNDIADADKDGQITEKDIKIYYNKVLNVLRYNVPSASGYAGGFTIGVYLG